MRVLRDVLLVLCAASAAVGCAARTSRNAIQDRNGFVVTAEQIQKTGARNAWEALRLSGAPISFGEDSKGNPQRVRQRGNSSIYLNNAPLLVVDEVRMTDLRYLLEIPAKSVSLIRVINGTTGTTRFGTGAGNGVIIVTTR